ncbi:hypothetical protein HMPREF1577_01170 [Gardnerella pickettii JCP8017A]|uniref:Uncharacterized protein n=1 Tax=Gardnerella pickettii JCP8017A TaxID=1261062 RepID=T2PLN0_9BIFI|nr:hypothetical protein HMPREF1577_01170 [Gardnerella pickettii JCP8017A]
MHTFSLLMIPQPQTLINNYLQYDFYKTTLKSQIILRQFVR